ncbi:MAG TPA: amidohydrolase family protein, partial [Coriobacteriia bacterium]|nr:amidohydrolase family protein [Coriobacteriia bacterium]
MLLLARYVIPVSGPHIDDGAVLVRDSVIEAIGTRADLMAAYPHEEVADYGLAALMPGFIDLHTHLEYSVFRGVVDDLPYTQWKMEVQRREAMLTPEDWADSAVLGAVEAIRSGITTIADVTDSGSSVAAAQDSGLRGVLYREVSTMDTAAVDGVLSDALSDMAEWGRIVDPERLVIGIAPHSPY